MIEKLNNKNNKFMLPLNLQHFAEDGVDDKGDDGKADDKTFTKEEMLALVQSEADKRVQQALATKEKQHQKELAKQKSLANMDEQQRKEAEANSKIEELENQLKDFRLTKEKAEIAKVLSNRGLNSNFVDMLSLTDDNAENLTIIDSFDKLFKASVKAEVEKRIPNQNPTTSTIGLEQGMTPAKLATLDYAQAEQYLKEHPDFLN